MKFNNNNSIRKYAMSGKKECPTGTTRKKKKIIKINGLNEFWAEIAVAMVKPT